MQSHYLRFCDRCLAMQGTKCPRSMDYRNIASDAAWPMTAISHQTYMALDHASLSPWRCMPGFNFLSITYDFTHNFFLGTARDLCASSIKVFIDNGLVGDPRTKGMDELLCLVHRRMRSMCREHGCLVLVLTTCSFSSSLSGNRGSCCKKLLQQRFSLFSCHAQIGYRFRASLTSHWQILEGKMDISPWAAGGKHLTSSSSSGGSQKNQSSWLVTAQTLYSMNSHTNICFLLIF